MPLVGSSEPIPVECAAVKLPGLKVADKVKKLSDKVDGVEGEAAAGLDRLRSQSALAISVLAALLALASAGADKASATVVNTNIQATDLWAFYQAKSTRQTVHLAAAEALEAELAGSGAAMDEAARQRVQESIARRRATAARYDDEPDPAAPGDPLRGDGKKQLMARAKDAEARRDQAVVQGRNFRFSAIVLQIAIVLGSVAILAQSRRTLVLVFVVGAAGAVLLLNGYLLFVHL